MIEVVGLTALFLGLVAAEVAAWRLVRGPTAGRRGNVARIAIVLLVTTPVALAAIWQLSRSRTVQLLGEMVSRVETTQPAVALTFDDGPNPVFTQEVLDVLADRDVQATFFVTGQSLEANPLEGERIVAAGHEMGNHSYSHVRMIARSYGFVRDEVETTDALIRDAGYTGEITFRPPYAKRLIVLSAYLSLTDRRTVLFDVEPESFPEITGDAQGIVQHVLDRTRPGSIILLHVMGEHGDESRAALPGIIDGLQNQGYAFVTVSELLALEE